MGKRGCAALKLSYCACPCSFSSACGTHVGGCRVDGGWRKAQIIVPEWDGLDVQCPGGPSVSHGSVDGRVYEGNPGGGSAFT